MGDSLVIPDNSPQPKNVYLEQIEILKPIIAKKNVSKDSSKQKSMPDLSGDAGPSSSKKVSNKGKTTIYNGELNTGVQLAKPGTMLEKLEKAAPYNLFFTTVNKAPETLKQPNAITFTDLLCPSLGDLKCSLQINFMIDIDWLLKQYKARNLSTKPLTIVYGDDWPDMAKFIDMFCPNVTYKFIKMKDPFGCHHSKIGIYVYEDNSVRVVVSSANLYYEDWNHYNQGLWLSPACPRLPESSAASEGESPTGFKANLLSYLGTYNLPCLQSFIDHVKRADFSAVRVFLVYSVPGRHYPNNVGSHLHRVGALLKQHCTLPSKTTPESEGPLSWGIIAQASSIGSMGKSPAEWLRGTLLRSLASHTKGPLPMNSNATLSIVYPSVDNVMTGYYGHESGGCLPYSKATNEKQRWLQEYMHQWKAEAYGRTRAMPHIKTYCRVSPCLTKLAYFLVTSANLSKSAWGGPVGKDSGVYVRSYEVGVLYLPKFFDEEYLEIKRTLSSKNKKLFPFMYDLPLVPYKSDDYPWCN
ncbi:probable tyrosyl-DNA phosphodiesterase isoform X2 [Anoplophora glabripennis]|nr:probable tyrosyl-DNA phosphodiesterase isoform X2 [Anoplophora glabripennis]